jgi:hypothetical protein
MLSFAKDLPGRNGQYFLRYDFVPVQWAPGRRAARPLGVEALNPIDPAGQPRGSIRWT